jgi:hypothetical protein
MEVMLVKALPSGNEGFSGSVLTRVSAGLTEKELRCLLEKEQGLSKVAVMRHRGRWLVKDRSQESPWW